MKFDLGGSLSGTQNTTNTSEESELETEKAINSNSTTSGFQIGNTTTKNSGSTNTSSTSTVGGTDASTNSVVTGPSSQLTTNSGSVNTSQVMLSQDAVNHLVEQMLSSNNGLASISGGQKQAGGYNSTTQTMLTNNLLAQVAGEVAVRGAQTVNTIGGSTSLVNNSGSTTTQNIGATTNYSNANTVQNVGASTSSSDSYNASSSMTDTKSLEDMVGISTSSSSKHDDKLTEEAHTNASWIVCTELVRQKRMPQRFYIYGLQAFSSYDSRGKRGYYIWAIPAVHHLRNKPKSKLSKAIELVMCARAEYLAAEAGCSKANKTIAGFLAKHVLYGICWTLSRTIAREFTKFSPDEVTYAG